MADKPEVFLSMSDDELLNFIVENENVFGSLVDDYMVAIKEALRHQASFFLRRPNGFALVRQERLRNPFLGPDDKKSELTLLYVRPEHRRQGIGADLVREAKLSYLRTLPMRLDCDVGDRVETFKAYGFDVTEENEKYVVMECAPNQAIG